MLISWVICVSESSPASKKIGNRERKRRLKSDDAERGVREGAVLFGRRVRSVIRSDGVDRPVNKAVNDGVAVLFRTKRRVHLGVGVGVADELIGRGKIMRRRLAGDVSKLLFLVPANHVYAPSRRAVAEMQPAAVSLRQIQIPGDHDVFAVIGDARERGHAGTFAGVHDPQTAHGEIFLVHHQKHVIQEGPAHGLRHDFDILDRQPVVRERDRAGGGKTRKVREAFSFHAFCHRGDRMNGDAGLPGTLQHVFQYRHAVYGGTRVRHAADVGVAAGGSCTRR